MKPQTRKPLEFPGPVETKPGARLSSDELKANGYVLVRERAGMHRVGMQIYTLGRDYGVYRESDAGYWVPCWFFMAVMPPLQRGDVPLANDRAYKVTFDEKYQAAMKAKYAMSRNQTVDSLSPTWDD